MGEGARIEYFIGNIDSLQEVFDAEYIFQFQEHYLDIKAPYSRWGKELNFKIKGDVVPDNVTFDLLRSSLLSRHTTSKGESWKARASEPKGCVQAWTAEVTAPGWIGWWLTRYRPIARAWKGSALVSEEPKLSRYL